MVPIHTPPSGIAGYAPDPFERHAWLNAERLARVRAVLLTVTLFVGLAVWVYHGLGPGRSHTTEFVHRLRGVGVMTWLYALVQMIDMRFYGSRFAQRRRAAMRIPDSLHGWLFGQMLAWFGILYYGLTEDPRWFAAGLVILLLSFVAFPIERVG